jgi:hypothetical protein
MLKLPPVMALTEQQITDVEYLSLDELRNWAFQLLDRIYNGACDEAIVTDVEMALAHSAASQLHPILYKKLARFLASVIPVKKVRSSRNEVVHNGGNVRLQRHETHNKAVSLLPIPGRAKPEKDAPVNEPRFRTSRIWDGTARIAIDRMAGRVVRK